MTPSKDESILAQPPLTFTGLTLDERSYAAAGIKAVLTSAQFSWSWDGPGRGTYALLKLNQKDGFDCSSCAWADPDGHRSVAEFCESGAKATANDADIRRADPDLFARYSLADLSRMTDRDLNRLGRLTHPMVVRPGDTHYRRISWTDAFELIADELNALDSPDEAVFYTSGKVPNEPAFLFQLFARQFGTNNLPDCSNMCHESSTAGLTDVLGLGKASVTLEDLETAEAILIIGHNPGTNTPRMLTALEKAKKRGAKIIAMNPLHEVGLTRFKNPQDFMNLVKAVGTLLGPGTTIADQYLKVRINGDMAALRGIMKHLFEADRADPGSVVDVGFVAQYTTGYRDLITNLDATRWEDIEQISGLTREQLKIAADIIGPRKKFITCWSMGVTQQKNGVQTIQEIVNLHLMKGAIGIPGAGVCPVRGHSNVQGDRTMGIWEKMKDEFLDSLGKEFNFAPPREHGLDVVKALKAMHENKTKVFFSLGGNLLSAGPDTNRIADAMRRQRMTVFVGTKPNRGHLTGGRTSLLLPCFTHSDIDRQRSGKQITSCENTMGVVSLNKGVLEPVAGEIMSEVAIISGVAMATLGSRSTANWVGFTENYDTIRDSISRVVPGFERYNERVRHPGGFYLPNGPRKRDFGKTKSGRAQFTVTTMEKPTLAPDQLVLMSIRSHDQFNTTVYDYNDRYRGVFGERRVIFMNAADMQERGLAERDLVNITSHFQGSQRHAEQFIALAYDIPRGNTAAYFPEMNVLVPLESVADQSNSPTTKYVVVTVVPTPKQVTSSNLTTA